MAGKRKNGLGVDELADVLRDILITQLGIAGVSQQNIRRIVGCDINRVNRIVKYIKESKRRQTD